MFTLSLCILCVFCKRNASSDVAVNLESLQSVYQLALTAHSSDSSVGVCWCVLSTFCHLSLGGIYAFAFILSYPLRLFAGPPPFPTCSTSSLCEIFELARHVCVLSNASCYVLLFFFSSDQGSCSGNIVVELYGY